MHPNGSRVCELVVAWRMPAFLCRFGSNRGALAWLACLLELRPRLDRMSDRWQVDASMSHAGEDFGGPAKRRSGWLIPLTVFFVTACLSALVLAYYLAPAPPGLAPEQPAPTDATRPVGLSRGSTRLRIPGQYILLARARRRAPTN